MQSRRATDSTLSITVVSARRCAFQRDRFLQGAILSLALTSATAQIQDFEGEGAVTGGGSTAGAGDFQLRSAVGQPGGSGLQRGGQFAVIGGVLGTEASSIVPGEIFSDGFEAKDLR